MLVFKFIANINGKDESWMNFLIKKVITENKVLETLGKENRPKFLKSATVVDDSMIPEEDTETSVQYDPALLNNGKEIKEYRPFVMIHTTMPGSIIDELRSQIKKGLDIESAVKKAVSLDLKIQGSKKKKNELIVLAKMYSMKPDGFDYLVVKC
ncbi:hypothetical protein ACFL05_00180 [Patescibacteria group bacterium]